MLWRNQVFLNGIGGSRKGEMSKVTQEVGSQKRKERTQMRTEYEWKVDQQTYLEAMTRLQES
jgi:hypothetical protein